MVQKTLLTFIACISVFFGLVYYNYLVTQKNLQNKLSTPQTVTITSFPNALKPDEFGNFVWQVSASPDQKTNTTTIYYGYESSPSALTINDSPSAVGYQYSLPDYQNGSFFLPDNFDVNIAFSKVGTVWFRAYANIRGEHIWSNESSLNIIP
jgi:hypothetical protein